MMGINGTIRINDDGGATFSHSRALTEARYPEGYFGYSSMVYLPGDSIGILFESDEDFESLDFIKLSMDWLKEDFI